MNCQFEVDLKSKMDPKLADAVSRLAVCPDSLDLPGGLLDLQKQLSSFYKHTSRWEVPDALGFQIWKVAYK